MENPIAVGCYTRQLTQYWEAKVKKETHLNQNQLQFCNQKCTKSHEKKENEKKNNFYI